MSKKQMLRIGVLLLWLILHGITLAQVPQLINYQALLTDPATGQPVADDTYEIIFSIYDVASGGTAIWTETHNVTTKNGLYSASLGSTTPVTSTILNGTERYLGVKVGADPEMAPRKRFLSVAYAIIGGNSWGLKGNTGTTAGTNFLGTTDNQALVFKTNSSETMRITANGQVGIGTSSPNQKLSVIGIVESTTGGFKFPDGTVQTTAATGGGNSWGLSGNSGTTPGTNFLGTTDNKALELKVNSARGLRLEPHATGINLVGGYGGNTVSSGVVGATIAGGGSADPFFGFNRVTDNYNTVGGGVDNQAGNGDADFTNVFVATVSGGSGNLASGDGSVVGGGVDNEANGDYATVSGGQFHDATGKQATVGGGWFNKATVDLSTIAGGGGNVGSARAATVGGGWLNEVAAEYGTIAGGGASVPADDATRNRVTDDYGTIGGGGNNLAGDNLGTTTDAIYATVSGGRRNKATADYATVGGGLGHDATGDYATIAGGWDNIAAALAATVGGGRGNFATNSHATIGGGGDNLASGHYATIAGGKSNLASGKYSFAAGRRAQASHHGAFVWADTTDADFISTADHQFLVRASGGVGIGTNSPGEQLSVNGVVESITGGFKFPDGTVQTTAATGGGNSWRLAGNSGTTPGADFLGTTDNQDVVFKTNASEAMRINTSRNVGIGTNNPTFKVDIEGGASPLRITGGGASFRKFQFDVQTGGFSVLHIYDNNTVEDFRFATNGDSWLSPAGNIGIGTNTPANILTVKQFSVTDPIADAWTLYSSRRWKQNIATITGALSKVQRLRGVSFDWKAGGKHDVGLIAEEVGEVIPEVVDYEENGVDAKSVDYARLVSVLIEAVKEQQQLIGKQQSAINSMEKRIAALEKGRDPAAGRFTGAVSTKKIPMPRHSRLNKYFP